MGAVPGRWRHRHRAYIEAPGAIAQLGERLLCKQEVTGSIPVGSIRAVPAQRRVFRPGMAGHR